LVSFLGSSKETVVVATPQPDPGALSITPADGYQYGDDHSWSTDDQAGLVTKLGKLLDKLHDAK
jgi:hypothetical protein